MARPGQDAKRRAGKKTAPVRGTTLPRSAHKMVEEIWRRDFDPVVAEFEQSLAAKDFGEGVVAVSLPALADADGATPVWDRAVESLGRSARVWEELAESTGEAIARIAARGDRIDRIQKETRALLNALVASEADA